MALVYFGKDQLVHLFTDNETVEDIMTETWPMIMVFIFFDTMQGVA